jgi:hypothetical protein
MSEFLAQWRSIQEKAETHHSRESNAKTETLELGLPKDTALPEEVGIQLSSDKTRMILKGTRKKAQDNRRQLYDS